MGANSSSAATKPVAPSIFSKDLRITGDLVSDGEIHVDGAVIGDVLHEDLSIEAGAFLEGHCRRLDSAAKDQITGKDQEAAQVKVAVPLGAVGKGGVAGTIFPKRDDEKKITVA